MFQIMGGSLPSNLCEKSVASGGPRSSKAVSASVPNPRPGMATVTWFPCHQALQHRRSALPATKPKGHETTLIEFGLGKCKHIKICIFFL